MGSHECCWCVAAAVSENFEAGAATPSRESDVVTRSRRFDVCVQFLCCFMWLSRGPRHQLVFGEPCSLCWLRVCNGKNTWGGATKGNPMEGDSVKTFIAGSLSVFCFTAAMLSQAISGAAYSAPKAPCKPIVVNGDQLTLAKSRKLGTKKKFRAVCLVTTDSSCTGTLIAPTKVLCAKHCFQKENSSGRIVLADPVAEGYYVTFSGEKTVRPDGFAEPEVLATRNIIAIDTLGASPTSRGTGDDIVVVTLDRAVPKSVAKPFKLTRKGNELLGKTGTLLGFGVYGVIEEPSTFNSGVFRRFGQNVIDQFSAFPGESKRTFDFDMDSGKEADNSLGSKKPLKYEAYPESGDSGSPLVVIIKKQPVVCGVLCCGGSGYGAINNYASVKDFASKIRKHKGVKFVD